MRCLALAAALLLSSSFGCTSTNNTNTNEPAKPAAASNQQQPQQQQKASSSPGWLDKMEHNTGAAWKKEQDHFKKNGAPVLANCRDDAHKMCASVEKDAPKMVQCLKQNESKLAPPCRNALEAYAKTHK
jgi:hypothetical protein